MLWIVGTSVSIEEGGYCSRLAQRLRAGPGIALANLSVGDQTSLMGCMRVLAHCDDFAQGDVVVWEYSLLDTLLGESLFPGDDVRDARRMAWACLFARGVHLLVLMTPPRRHLHRRSMQESEIANDAAFLDVRCIDGRDLFAQLGTVDPADHYRDDRHPRLDSPIVDLMATRILDAVVALHGHAPWRPDPARLEQWRARAVPDWRWLDAAALAGEGAAQARTFSNSLTSIDTVSLAIDARIGIAAATRIVGIGMVSTHVSGGLWCGHPDCAPASTRLPEDLDYSFLLRSTTLPCRHGRIETLVSAPAQAYGRHVCAAYGQARCSAVGPVAIFGLLYEAADDRTTPRGRLLRYLKRRRSLRYLQLQPATIATRIAWKLQSYVRRLRG